MSGKVCSMVLETALEPTKKLVMLAMADHASPDGWDIFPSIKTVSEEASVSERTVQRVLVEMQDIGLLIVVNKATGRPGKATEYRIDLEKLATMKRAPTCHPSRERGDSRNMDGCHPRQRGVTPVTETGDTAMAPEPSCNRYEEPSEEPYLPSVGSAREEELSLPGVPAKPDQKALLEQIGVKVAAAIPDNVPVAAMVASYHKLVPSGSRLRKLTPSHVTGLKRVWKELEKSADAWKEFLLRIEASDWLAGRVTGSDGRSFGALDIIWITGPKNFEKIIGGRYDNRIPQGGNINTGSVEDARRRLSEALV